MLEERKKRLAAEGLFEESRKRPLPFLPRVVGVITSPTGSVIRDMLHGFTERFPACVLIWPVRVQGETSADEVRLAVEGFNALGPGARIPRPDVLIIARGGGSLEDLWGFNDEALARAVAASGIPVISAVGHETDWTLIDFVADARAPTPTKAAEWAVPKQSELIARMTELYHRQRHAVARAIEGNRSDLRAASRGLPKPQDLLGLARQRFDAASGRLRHALRGFASEKRSRLVRWQGRLDVRLIAQRAERCHERVRAMDREMRQVVRRLVQQRHVLLSRQAARLGPGLLRHPASRGREKLDQLAGRGRHTMIACLEKRRRHVDSLGQLLRSLSHKSVLDRGFVLVRDTDGRMLRRVADAEAALSVELEFCDGRAAAEMQQGASARKDGPANAKPAKPARAAGNETASGSKGATEKQGQLF